MTEKTKARRGTKTPYWPKDPPTRSHLLTEFAKRVLDAASKRTKASESNVVEHLVRLHAGQLTADEFAPVADQSDQQQ